MLTAVEGLVGSTGSGKHNFQAKLCAQADKLIQKRVESISTEIVIVADESNDGKVSFEEFKGWVDKQPQIIGWVEGLGAYWAAMAQASGEENTDPRINTGRDDAQRLMNAARVSEYLSEKMGGIPLRGEGGSLGLAGYKTSYTGPKQGQMSPLSRRFLPAYVVDTHRWQPRGRRTRLLGASLSHLIAPFWLDMPSSW